MAQLNLTEMMLVSILVFLEPLLRHPPSELQTGNPEVSILVFLEPLLRQCVDCCGGSALEVFQSLFFWNHYLDKGEGLFLFDRFLFQSLFFWNHYLD